MTSNPNDPKYFDFNDIDQQRSLDVIPQNTIATLQLTIRPGGAGTGGWFKRSADGASEGLDCEFTVVDGPFAKRKLWQLFTLQGTTQGHAKAGKISRDTFGWIWESARGIRPDDRGEAAQAARKVAAGWQDFDGLRFVARLGVEPATDKYKAKNTILEVITPDRQAWKKPEQIQRDLTGKPAAATSPSETATPPANAIARPKWAAG